MKHDDHLAASIGQSSPPLHTNLIREAWRKSYVGLASVGIFSVFINLLKLVVPLYILQILDRVIASRSLETLLMLSIITVIALAVGVVLEAIRRRLLMSWGSWIERGFGPLLFSGGLQKNPLQNSDSSRVLRDLTRIRVFVSGQGLVAWLDLIWAPFFIALVFMISSTLGLILLIGGIIAVALGTANEMMSRESRNATYEAGQLDRDLIASVERNQESVGSLNIVRNLARLWSTSASIRLEESIRTRAITVYFSAAIRFVGRLVRIAVLGVGVMLVINDPGFTLGSVVAANVLARTAYTLIQRAMLRWRELKLAGKSYQNIKVSLRNLQPYHLSRTASDEAIVFVFDDVGYRYPHKASSVLRRVSIQLTAGEILCVVGPSASGKSTFCRLAAGLVSPRTGRVTLGDVNVFLLQQKSELNEIGYLPQDIVLFRGTVRQNIASMAQGDMNLVAEAARLAGIHDAILHLPQGYDTEISDKEPLLSAGQRKMLAIARAFYGMPPLIVLDEPFPHLDARSRSAIMSSLIYMKSRGVTIIYSAQTMRMARSADKAIKILPTKKRHIVLDTAEKIGELLKRQKDVGAKRARSKSRKERSRKKKDAGVVRMLRTRDGRQES